jgi:uncharacterized protein
MKLIFDGPENGPLFIFAHGAGAPLTSDFIEKVTAGLVLEGIRVIRFNFNYMQQRVETGSRRPPERVAALIEQFREVVETFEQPIVIGGKSMGGRIASMLAAEDSIECSLGIKGVACLGYPFHPQGKAEKLRTEHLNTITMPVAIIQGTRDKLGNKAEISTYQLSEAFQWLWLEDGDHDFKPRVKSGFTQTLHIQSTTKYLANYVKECVKKL